MAHREGAAAGRRTTSPAGPRARSGSLLLAGTLASNLLSYAFFVVLSRSLDGGQLGAVGSLVNLSVLAGVPALGLQLVGARLVSHADADRVDEVAADLRRFSLRLGVVVALVLAGGSPVVARLLDVDVLLVLALAAAMVPVTVVFACQGVLQGAERFGALAVVLAASGVAKFIAALGSSWFGSGIVAVVVLFGLGWFAVAGLALAMTRDRTTLGRRGAAPVRHLGGLVAAAVVPTSGLLFLSSVDVLLARVHLDPDASGAYTMGALFEKAAFWGLSFLATLFYPAMARSSERRAAILRALAITAGAGLVGVVVTAVLGGPLVSLVAGPAYAATAPLVWRFTLLGVCLALVQVIAYAGLAAASHRMGVAMWLAGALAVAATTLHHDDVAAVVDAVLLTAIALVVVGAAIEWRWIRAVPREDVAGAAGRDGVGARVGAAPGVGVGGAPAAGVSGRRRARSGRPRR